MGNYFTKEQRRYGWIKSTSEDKALYRTFSLSVDDNLPKSVDLRGSCPPVYNQGKLGSCTANALAAAYQFDEMKQGGQDMEPSRLFIYYNERAEQGTINEDSGATLTVGINVLNTIGTCSETSWPYNVENFTEKPSDACFTEALNHKSIDAQKVIQDENQLKQCLVNGYPVVFGFTVYASFESADVEKTGIVPMPKDGEKVLGGHAVVCVGYDSDKNWFICRNSWGPTWGDNGYFYLPNDYILDPNQANDFWTITKTQDQ